MKRCRIYQYGRIPETTNGEKEQFERVLKIVTENQHNLGEWIVMCIAVNYQHNAGDRLDNDCDWNGEYDLVLFAQRRIIVYELKSAAMRLLWGRSDDRKWRFRKNDGQKVERESEFYQISRQRAAFVQDFLVNPEVAGRLVREKHFKVDHRLVISDNADYSNFYYTLPQDLDDDELESEVIPNVATEVEREFIRSMYSLPFVRRGAPARRLKKDRSKSEMQRLVNVMPAEWQGKRIKRWFRILKESEIEADLSAPGYRDFELTETEARAIAEAMISAS